MQRKWTLAQLGKWRIRKARPGEMPEWWVPLPGRLPPPPWYVWPPNGVVLPREVGDGPLTCFSSRRSAQAYVDDAIATHRGNEREVRE